MHFLKLIRNSLLTTVSFISSAAFISSTAIIFPEITQAQPPLLAIIDTGTNLSATNLKEKLWINTQEIPNNGIDDDGNGFIDDINGWDFSSGSNNVSDIHGHGTHITSLIAPAAQKNSLMILKYYSEKNSPELNFKNCLKSFEYAIKMGAKIINFSGGGYGASALERSILELAERKNILIISAAGNDHLNNDQSPFFPASYPLSNIVSVGSLAKDGQISRFSNFGRNSVSLFHPGEKILGLGLDLKSTDLSGTSQATALVTAEIINLMNQQEISSKSVHDFDLPINHLAPKIKLTSSMDQRLHLDKILRLRDSNQTVFGQKFRKAFLRPQTWLE